MRALALTAGGALLSSMAVLTAWMFGWMPRPWLRRIDRWVLDDQQDPQSVGPMWDDRGLAQ